MLAEKANPFSNKILIQDVLCIFFSSTGPSDLMLTEILSHTRYRANKWSSNELGGSFQFIFENGLPGIFATII